MGSPTLEGPLTTLSSHSSGSGLPPVLSSQERPFPSSCLQEEPSGQCTVLHWGTEPGKPLLYPGIMRNRAGHQEAREAAEPGPEPCSLRFHHRRQIPDFTGQSEVRLGSSRPSVFLPVSIYTAWLFLESSIDHLPYDELPEGKVRSPYSGNPRQNRMWLHTGI